MPSALLLALVWAVATAPEQHGGDAHGEGELADDGEGDTESRADEPGHGGDTGDGRGHDGDDAQGHEPQAHEADDGAHDPDGFQDGHATARPAAPAGRPIEGRVIEHALNLERIEVRVDIDLLPGEVRESADVRLAAAIEVSHDLDAQIGELEVGLAILTAPQLDFVWSRLHTPPMHLETAMVERKLPYPAAVLTMSDGETLLPRDTPRSFTQDEQLDELPLPRHGAFTYLAAVSGYVLVAPSERDVMHLLEHGGPSDLAALAVWASQQANDNAAPFDDAARARIMDAVGVRVTQLRAPPGFGDYQRLNALTALAYLCLRPDDLERLLVLQRPMSLLLASAQVSYDGAAAEEGTLGISVHGFRRLQSRSDSALSWEASLRRLRTLALDRVVRLAADPLDFPNGPRGNVRRAPLQVQATRLLDPLDTTQVARLLGAAAERVEVQRELMRFYIEMAYAPAVEPLLDWLIEHPGEIEDVGVLAMQRNGGLMLPVLLRRFDDLDAGLDERVVVWRLLAALPEGHAGDLAAACRSLGIEVPPEQTHPDVATLLVAVRAHDERSQERRIAELISRLRPGEPGKPVARATLRVQVKAARQLGELAPARLEALAADVIAQHVAAARDAEFDAPGEARATLRQLGELPLGAHHGAALEACALARADALALRGDPMAALDELARHDPELAASAIRARYVELLDGEYERLFEAGAWDALEPVLERGEVVAEDFELDARREQILAARRRPLYILAGVVGSALLGLGIAFAHSRGWLQRRRPPHTDEAEPTTDAAETHVNDDDDDHDDDDRVAADVDASRDAAQEADAAEDTAIIAGDPPWSADPDASWSADEDPSRSPLDDFAA